MLIVGVATRTSRRAQRGRSSPARPLGATGARGGDARRRRVHPLTTGLLTPKFGKEYDWWVRFEKESVWWKERYF
jgi:hypothetical protein